MPPYSLWSWCLEQCMQFWPLCLHNDATDLEKDLAKGKKSCQNKAQLL